MTIAREKLQEKQKNIMETLERLDYKINLYTEIEEGKRKDRTRWDSNPQPLGPKPNALSVAPRDQGSKQFPHLRPISVDRLHSDEKALREDRTPDLSLTKRVLYRLSY